MRSKKRWLASFVVLAAFVIVVLGFAEERRFAEIARNAQPAWVLAMLVLQATTYPVLARVWLPILRRADGATVRTRTLVRVVLALAFVLTASVVALAVALATPLASLIVAKALARVPRRVRRMRTVRSVHEALASVPFERFGVRTLASVVALRVAIVVLDGMTLAAALAAIGHPIVVPTALGVPFEAAAAGTLLMRGFSFWLPMLPGVWFARRELAA